MQQFGFELASPLRNEQDLLDFSTRHPLDMTTNNTFESELTIILDDLQVKTQKDPVFRKIMYHIYENSVNSFWKDATMKAYHNIWNYMLQTDCY